MNNSFSWRGGDCIKAKSWIFINSLAHSDTSIRVRCAHWWRFLLCIPNWEFLQPAVFWNLLSELGSVLCPLKQKEQRCNHTASYASMTFKRESAPWMPLQHLLLSVSQMPRLLLSFLWKFLETPTQWRSQVSWINAWTPAGQTKWAYEDTITYELFFCIFLCLAPTLNHQLHSHSGTVLVPVLFIPHSEKKNN